MTPKNKIKEDYHAKNESKERSGKNTSCPECDGKIISEAHERRCSDCGLVVENRNIDRGKEWRSSTAKEENKKSRVGSPRTVLRHDKGLSTNIPSQNKDSNGNHITPNQRRKLKRIRRRNKESKIQSGKEQMLSQALGEIQRMRSALGIDGTTTELAAKLFRRCHDENIVKGRSIEGMASACLYIATRINGNTSRSIDEIETVSRVGRIKVQRSVTKINKELELKLAPPEPEDFVNQIISSLDNIDKHTELLAKRLIKKSKEENVHVGKDPRSIVCGAIYYSVTINRRNVSQQEIAKEANITPAALRDSYEDIIDHADKSWIQYDSVNAQ